MHVSELHADCLAPNVLVNLTVKDFYGERLTSKSHASTEVHVIAYTNTYAVMPYKVGFTAI